VANFPSEKFGAERSLWNEFFR